MCRHRKLVAFSEQNFTLLEMSFHSAAFVNSENASNAKWNIEQWQDLRARGVFTQMLSFLVALKQFLIVIDIYLTRNKQSFMELGTLNLGC